MATISLREATRYYAQLLAYQYRDLPRASQFIELLTKQALGDLFGLQVQDAYNVDDAIGAQLDVIGRYVGASRVVAIPIQRPFFGLWLSGITDPLFQNLNGFSDSTDPAVNPQAIFYRAQFVRQSNVMLDDVAYRLLIKLKIILNTTDSSLAEIQEYLHTFLPGLVTVVDNEDMTLTYTFLKQTPLPSSVLALYMPKPAGVGRIIVIFDASASPDHINQTFPVSAPTTQTSIPITVTAVHGTPPYTYSWVRLTESRPDFPDFPGTTADSPTSATTTFTHSFGGTGIKTSISTWNCIVNDSSGLSTIVGPISVTLIAGGPP